MRQAPLVVTRGEGVGAARARVAAAGLRLVEGFDIGTAPWDLRSEGIVCVGAVRTSDDLAGALRIAARQS